MPWGPHRVGSGEAWGGKEPVGEEVGEEGWWWAGGRAHGALEA